MKVTSTRRWMLATVILALIVGSGVPSVSPSVATIGCMTTYTLTDLGTLGGPSSGVADMNDAGTLVGNAFAADGQGLPTRCG